MEIEIIDPEPGLDTDLIELCVKQVFSGERKTPDYINVVFLNRDDLRLLKKEYFNLDVYTDVVAFNLNEPGDAIEGEIYLSHEQIKENATAFDTKPQEELFRVLIHGCLHLCDYEDETEELKQEMTKLENKYLELVGIVKS